MRMTMTRACGSLAILVGIALATACGDNVAEPGGEAIPVPRSDATAVLPPDLPTFCPPASQRPTSSNTPCQGEGSTCEYGASPDMQCNKTFACIADSSGQNLWLERATDRCFKTLCPTTATAIEALDNQPCTIPPTDAGATSDADEAVCAMTNGICACTTGAGGSDLHERRWVCVRPDVGGCPVERPRAGESCNGNLWCDYGSCKWKRGLLMQCKDQHWISGGAPCN
jgi:hypothetical protein